jgi:hypothetical protein
MNMKFKTEVTITVEEEKNLQPYLGKYILRDGDLHAEMLTMDLVCRYLYTSRFLKHLEQTGLLFDTWEEAERARELLVLTLKKK